MKNLVRAFGIIILLFFLALGIFYFWGSDGNISQLNELKQYDVPPGISKDTFSVMTFNIGFLSGMTNNLPVEPDPELYKKNLKAAYTFIDDIDPDFIGFQEIDFQSERSFSINQLDSIARYSEYAYGVAATNWDKNYVPFPYWPPSVHFGKMHSGQAILSKYPVVESKRIVLEQPENAPFYYNAFYLDRLIQVTKINVNKNTPLILMNVHLEAFDQETREQQAQVVLDQYKKFKDKFPVLLIGDFNMRPPYASEKISDEATIQYFLEEPGLKAAITKSMYLAGESDYFTYNTEKPYEQLDYIFYNSDKIHAVEAYVAQEAKQISDHLPVVMEFTFMQ